MSRKLELYLRQVGKYLVNEDREDILMEIRAHIMEKSADGDELTDEKLHRVLSEMPNPRLLATNYSEGKEIISSDLRNFLFLYTGILFAVHLGITIIASIASRTLAVFPFFFAPAMDNLPSILLFLPFAFIFDFGVVCLFLFTVSQWAPNLSLPLPEVSLSDIKRPGWGSLLGQLLALAVFASIWYFHDQFLSGLIHLSNDTVVILPARDIFILPMVTLAIGTIFTALRMLSKSRLLPALGATATLLGLWFVDAFVQNPAVFNISGEPWDLLNRLFFKSLLILIAVLTTIDLAKTIVPMFTIPEEPKTVRFRTARLERWNKNIIWVVLLLAVVIGIAISLLFLFPIF
jgi:hypothetical protein